MSVASDLTAPLVALGLAFGRLGCFLAGCCFGKTTDSRNAFVRALARLPVGEQIGELARIEAKIDVVR